MTAGGDGRQTSIEGEFSRVRTRRVSDDAVDQFMGLLRSGRLSQGTKLPSEREMVGLLGVSRNSYREAVRVLETKGVLRVVPGKGTWVSSASPAELSGSGVSWLASHEADVVDLLEVREALDVKAVALAAERASPEQIEAVLRSLGEMSDALKTGDVEAILAADTTFHSSIARASGNRVLAEGVARLYELLTDARRAMIGIPGRLRRTGIEHRSIAQAIDSRDPESAARIMRQHVRRVEEEVHIAIRSARNGGDSG